MNKYLIVALVMFLPVSVFATSGACSYHGGVNCKVISAMDGSAICNDGSVSSVQYSDMAECRQTTGPAYCIPPVAGMCTTQADVGRLQIRGYQLGAAEQDPTFQSNVIAPCQAAVINYQAQQLAYQTCLNSQSTYTSPTPIYSSNTSCQNQFGTYAIPSKDSGYCTCQSGYHFDDNKQCVPLPTPDQSCKLQYGSYSIASTTPGSCSCSPGWYFGGDSGSKRCIMIDDSYCKQVFGETYSLNDFRNTCIQRGVVETVKPKVIVATTSNTENQNPMFAKYSDVPGKTKSTTTIPVVHSDRADEIRAIGKSAQVSIKGTTTKEVQQATTSQIVTPESSENVGTAKPSFLKRIGSWFMGFFRVLN